MPILNEIIKYNINNPRVHKRFINAGYIPNNEGNISITQINLYKLVNNNQKLNCICDLCNCCFTITISALHRTNYDISQKLYCHRCKIEQTCLSRYGVKTPFHSKEIQNKIIQNNLQKYGVRKPTQRKDVLQKREQNNLRKYGVKEPVILPAITQKREQTNLKRYGVRMPFYSKEIQNKIKQNNLFKYGAENPFAIAQFKEKIKHTNLKRYGVIYFTQSIIMQEKVRQTMHKNGTCNTSKQQLYFYNLLKNNEIDKNNIQLNYPLNTLSLDIILLNEKINIEYNGGGHNLDVKLNGSTQEQFIQREIKRNKFIKSQGWKQIFIISPNDKIHNYTDAEYLKMIYIAKMYLLNTSHHWVEIYTEENKFRTNVYEQSIINILNT